MKQNILFIVIIIVAGILLISAFVPLDIKPGKTNVSCTPSPKYAGPSDTFTLNIDCTPNAGAVKSWEFFVHFTPSKLKANSVTVGNFFSGYQQMFSGAIIDNTIGEIYGGVTNGVRYRMYNLIVGQGSVSSPGTFISISFTGKGVGGSSVVRVDEVGVTNENAYLPVHVNNGTVRLYENIGTYTEYDPSNYLTRSTTGITITNMLRNAQSYVQRAKSLGTGAFTLEFDIKATKLDSPKANGDQGGTMTLLFTNKQTSNTYTKATESNDGLCFTFMSYKQGGVKYKMRISSLTPNPDTYAEWVGPTLNIEYHVKIVRATGMVTCYIYQSSTLKWTSSVILDPTSISYFTPICGKGDSVTKYGASGYIKNFAFW